MKPILIYAMPRTKSFAALYAAKRTNRYSEPFAMREFDPTLSAIPPHKKCMIEGDQVISRSRWDSLAAAMQQPESVSKFFGIDIHYCHPARHWWNQMQQSDTADIYVLQRDWHKIANSFILANAFGFDYYAQRDKLPKTLKEDVVLCDFDAILSAHLRYFPAKGRLLDYDNLPADEFDKQLANNRVPSQDNWRYADLITNLQSLQQGLGRIIDWYADEWDAKERSLQP